MKITDRIPDILAALIALLFLIQFFTLAYYTYLNGGYSGHDLGKNNQNMWLLVNLKPPFNTITGNHMLGDHIHLIFLLLMPIYFLWQSPLCLLFLNVLFHSTGIYIAYLLATKILSNKWLGLFFALILLLNPEYNNASVDQFYPEELSPPFILLAFYLLLRDNHIGYIIMTLLLASVKQDAPTTSAFMFLFLLIRTLIYDRTNKKLIAISFALMLLMPIYFYAAVRTVEIYSGGTRGRYDPSYFTSFDTNKYNISAYINDLTIPDRQKYIDNMLGPFAYTPLLSPEITILSSPSFIFNLFTSWPYARINSFHYSVYITPFLLIAVMYLYAKIIFISKKTTNNKYILWFILLSLSYIILNASLEHNKEGSKIPITKYPTKIQETIHWYENNQERKDFEKAFALVPPQANISADVFLISHLTNRPHAYQYPNPWQRSYYGYAPNATQPDPATIEYILIKYKIIPNDQKTIIDNLEKNHQFEPIYKNTDASIMLYKRINPPKSTKIPKPITI
jgi:uncharacterized membrane protein